MGKKTRKTRWRALLINGACSEESEDCSSTQALTNGHYEHEPRLNTSWSRRAAWQNGVSSARSKYSAHNRNSYQPYSNSSSTDRQSNTTQDSKQQNGTTKITFNEDEYTRITTPRQDVLFKKGYLSIPRPHLNTQQSVSTTGNGSPAPRSTPSTTPDHHSADGTESGESCEYDQSPFLYPPTNGFIDHNGVCYVSGMPGFEPFPGFVVYSAGPVCYASPAPPFPSRKRGENDPQSNDYYQHNSYEYPAGEVHFDQRQEVVEPETHSCDTRRPKKKRRRRKISRSKTPNEATTDGYTDEEYSSDNNSVSASDDNSSEQIETNSKPVQKLSDKEDCASVQKQLPCSNVIDTASDSSLSELSFDRRKSDSPTENVHESGYNTECSNNQQSTTLERLNSTNTAQTNNNVEEEKQTVPSDKENDQNITKNDKINNSSTPQLVLEDNKNSETLQTDKIKNAQNKNTKIRVDAEEFIPRAYRNQIQIQNFVPIPIIPGDMYTNFPNPAFLSPINFVPNFISNQFYPINPENFYPEAQQTIDYENKQNHNEQTSEIHNHNFETNNVLNKNINTVDIEKIVTKLEIDAQTNKQLITNSDNKTDNQQLSPKKSQNVVINKRTNHQRRLPQQKMENPLENQNCQRQQNEQQNTSQNLEVKENPVAQTTTSTAQTTPQICQQTSQTNESPKVQQLDRRSPNGPKEVSNNQTEEVKILSNVQNKTSQEKKEVGLNISIVQQKVQVSPIVSAQQISPVVQPKAPSTSVAQKEDQTIQQRIHKNVQNSPVRRNSVQNQSNDFQKTEATPERVQNGVTTQERLQNGSTPQKRLQTSPNTVERLPNQNGQGRIQRSPVPQRNGHPPHVQSKVQNGYARPQNSPNRSTERIVNSPSRTVRNSPHTIQNGHNASHTVQNGQNVPQKDFSRMLKSSVSLIEKRNDKTTVYKKQNSYNENSKTPNRNKNYHETRTNTSKPSTNKQTNEKVPPKTVIEKETEPIVQSSDSWISVSRKKRKNKYGLLNENNDSFDLTDETSNNTTIESYQHVETSPVKELSIEESVAEIEKTYELLEKVNNQTITKENNDEEKKTIEEPTLIKVETKEVELIPQVIENVPVDISKNDNKKSNKKDKSKSKPQKTTNKRILINDLELNLELNINRHETEKEKVTKTNDVPIKKNETEDIKTVESCETVARDTKIVQNEQIPQKIEKEALKIEPKSSINVKKTENNTNNNKNKKKKLKKKNSKPESSPKLVGKISNNEQDSFDFLINESQSFDCPDSKTNVEISQVLDQMIQRGLYANLEEKLKTFNPSDSFIKSVTEEKFNSIDLNKSVDKLKNFDFSGVLFNTTMNKTFEKLIQNKKDIKSDVNIKCDTKSEVILLENQSNGLGNFPITKAVKDWMNKTRENTPEVEILKSVTEIRSEYLICNDLSDSESEESDPKNAVGLPVHVKLVKTDSKCIGESHESSPDLLDCWDDIEIKDFDNKTILLKDDPNTDKIIASVQNQDIDKIEFYDSHYGKNEDYLCICKEAQENCTIKQSKNVNFPRDGGLPHRAICCTVM